MVRVSLSVMSYDATMERLLTVSGGIHPALFRKTSFRESGFPTNLENHF